MDYIRKGAELLERSAGPHAKESVLSETSIVMIVILLYLASTLLIIPSWMRSRRAFGLKKAMIIYNIVQIVLNVILCFKLAAFLSRSGLQLCFSVYDATKTFEIQYSYFLLKCLDILDTVIFALRKKRGQISFLHLYHHVGMVLSAWLAYVVDLGGQVMYLGIVNTFVHVLMYTYYLCTVFNPKIRENVALKRRLTEIQIMQQVALTIIFCVPLIDANCHGSKKWFYGIYVIQGVAMISLFIHFYVKCYLKPKTRNVKVN